MPFNILFIIIFFISSVRVFGGVSSCPQIVDKELRDKIGQMLIIGFGGFKQDKESGEFLWNDEDGTRFKEKSIIAQHIANDHIGGVILFVKPNRDVRTGGFIRDRNIQNPEQVAKLNRELQEYNDLIRQEQKLDGLPLFTSVDQEGGSIDRLPAVLGFPVRTLLPQALGAKREMQISAKGCSSEVLKKDEKVSETYDYAERLAQEIADANFNLNFSPVVDVNVNPINPIIGGLGRSFSSNPEVVVDQARQFIKAFRDKNIISVLKHFPGHGSSSGDSHLGLVDVTDSYKKEDELYPYRKLIKDGYADIVMTSHVINGQIDQTQCKNGEKSDHTTWCPGTMSEKTLIGLLHDELGFKGLIVSDDMTMGAISEQYPLKDSLKRSINAGVDIFIVANNTVDQTEEVINIIVQLVKDGEIKLEKINTAYERISEFKKEKIIKAQIVIDSLEKDNCVNFWLICKIKSIIRHKFF